MRHALLVMLLVGVTFLSGCSVLEWKAKSGLQVLTNDIRSSVFLDGQLLDKTPYVNKEIKPGEYLLQIQPDDPAFVPYSTKVTLHNGFLTVITWKPGKTPETSGGVVYEAEPLPTNNGTKLTIISIPDTAIVQVGGTVRGFTPLPLEDLSSGTQEYQVSLPSYETQKHTINLLPGYHMHVTVKLAKEDDAGITGTSLVDPSPAPVIEIEKVKILKTGFSRNSQEGLRVRQLPNSTSTDIGFAITGQEYPLIENNLSGWYKIKVDDQEGWVSGKFSEVVE